MRNKFLILLFGLLLAVGWTNDASAQALPDATYKSGISFIMEEIGRPSGNAMNQGKQFKAPLRSQNYSVTSPVVHPKSWYQALPDVTWDGGSQNITEPFTTVDGMMALVERVYTDKDIPGFKYSEPRQRDIPYQTIQHGWDIIGSSYEPFTITTQNYDTYIYRITVRNADDEDIVSWTPSSDGTTLPTGWSCNATIKTYTYENYKCAYLGNASSGGTITINPSSFVNDAVDGYVKLAIWYAAESATTITVNGSDWNVTTSWKGTYTTCIGNISTPPDSCGYTVLLVKLQDDFSERAPQYTYSNQELRNFFQTYIKEMQLLTDGLRVNEGTDDAGTLFAYTGDLNKFYFIGKGKMYFLSSLDVDSLDRAPFYSMYEEFSPYVSGGTEDHTDLYEKMRQGATYPVVHDCEGVVYMRHWFTISSEDGSTDNRVNALVFYIPDNRGENGQGQTYEVDHQPTVGMYMIDLYAEIEPSATPDVYTATVTWEDNLNVITHSDGIPQTYYLYRIMDEDGDGVMDTTLVTPNGTPNTYWTEDFPVGENGAYDVYYYVIGVPTAATNKDTFFAKSNTDDVTVPGKNDFIGLQWVRYESDYVTKNEYDPQNHEVNYYRNWLAPHKLSILGQAGISAGNVGTTGRTLTLYREDEPIIDLELVMNGNKAYYRIKYRDRANKQQVEHGYNENTGELENNN